MRTKLMIMGLWAMAAGLWAQCTNGDCANGNGRFLYDNGDRYLGEFKNSIPNGRGAYYFGNGDLYKGQFKNGERHGYGTMQWKNGDKYIGEYAHNQREGDGTYYFADGREKKGVFKAGVLVQEILPPAPPKLDSPQVIAERGGSDPFAKASGNKTEAKGQRIAPTAGVIEGEKRVALLIGNGNYGAVPLKNATNDAQGMAKALGQLGFEVWLYVDADKRDMKTAIRDFSQYLNTNKAVGLFFYAGHGLQAEGRNYLVPVDADIKGVQDIEFEAFDLGRLLVEMEFAENPMNIVILDACRDNPYKSEFGERYKAHTGFTQIQSAPVNSVIAFSTAPGATASDGAGEHGLYTEALLKTLEAHPEKKLEDVFKQVRATVRKASSGKQIPWENSAIETDFFFKK